MFKPILIFIIIHLSDMYQVGDGQWGSIELIDDLTIIAFLDFNSKRMAVIDSILNMKCLVDLTGSQN